MAFFRVYSQAAAKNADDAAMVGHARDAGEGNAVRKFKRQENFKRMLEKIGKIVEDHISQPRPDHQAQNDHRGEVVDLLAGDVKAALVLQAIDHQAIRDGEGHNVHQPVVLQLERADLKNDRADVLRQMLPPRSRIESCFIPDD